MATTNKKNRKKVERIIFDNDIDFDEFKKMEYEGFEDDDEEIARLDRLTDSQWWDRLADYESMWFDDERCNLNKETDGVIVAIADLGLWTGRHIGVRVLKSNINSIMDVCYNYDYVKLYADQYNVHAELIHHDGTNYITFRLAKDYDTAQALEDMAESGELTWDKAMRKTKSIVKDVNKIFGWGSTRKKKKTA